MPVFQSGQEPPEWCELRRFEIVRLQPGEKRVFERTYLREKLIVAEGVVEVQHLGTIAQAERRAKFDLKEEDPPFAIRATDGPDGAIVVWMGGHWSDPTGGSGIFQVAVPEERVVRGDEVSYPKVTSFDNHYHDCDEYWIVYKGRGVAVSEGVAYEVGPGDCIATAMGQHHDFPQVSEPVRAAFFETTLMGERRRGHLWNHTHGQAQPDPRRA